MSEQKFKFELTCRKQIESASESIDAQRGSIEDALNEEYHQTEMLDEFSILDDNYEDDGEFADYMVEMFDFLGDSYWCDNTISGEALSAAIIKAIKDAGPNPKFPIVVKADV